MAAMEAADEKGGDGRCSCESAPRIDAPCETKTAHVAYILRADPGDPNWALTDKQLGEQLCDWLAGVGLPVSAPVQRTVTQRLRFAYPVYDRDFETHVKTMENWLNNLEGLLTFGRQGLFAHDNTHHANQQYYRQRCQAKQKKIIPTGRNPP